MLKRVSILTLAVFFVAGNTTSGSNQKLWKTDGTTNNTVQVKSLRSTINTVLSDVASPSPN